MYTVSVNADTKDLRYGNDALFSFDWSVQYGRKRFYERGAADHRSGDEGAEKRKMAEAV